MLKCAVWRLALAISSNLWNHSGAHKAAQGAGYCVLRDHHSWCKSAWLQGFWSKFSCLSSGKHLKSSSKSRMLVNPGTRTGVWAGVTQFPGCAVKLVLCSVSASSCEGLISYTAPGCHLCSLPGSSSYFKNTTLLSSDFCVLWPESGQH